MRHELFIESLLTRETRLSAGIAVALNPHNGAGVDKNRMAALLHRALDNDELTLHYQAKVDAGSTPGVGAAALLRWHNPQLGDVSPAVFLPLAEELELVLPLGRWVIAEACAQLAAWRQQGLTIDSVAVNLSPRQFADPELIDFVAAMLAVHQLEGFRLELEITNAAMIHKPECALESVRALEALGVRVAIDSLCIYNTPSTATAFINLLQQSECQRR